MQRPGPNTVKLFDIRYTTYNTRIIALLVDSWTSEDRLRVSIVDTLPRDHIDIRPHGTSSSRWKYSEDEKVIVSQAAFIVNYSQGGYEERR